MPDRPAPVTDLAWSPQHAEDLGGRVLVLWTELLERLPAEPVTCFVNEADDIERLLAVAAELGELEQQRRVV
jgi:hypothetical protein